MKIKKIAQTPGLLATVVDNLNSTSKTDALSANQGNTLAQYLNQLSQNPVGEYILWQDNYFGTENGSYHTLGIRYSAIDGIYSKFPTKSGFTRKYNLCMEYSTTNISNEKMYLRFDNYASVELKTYSFANIWGSTDNGIRSLGIIKDINISEITPSDYHLIIKASPYFGSGATFRIYKIYLQVYDILNLE